MIRFAALGSGSRGNAMVVEVGATRVLLDCGFGPRELARRLARLDLTPADLTAIVLTHEHSDHVGGAAACSRRYSLPLHLSHGTFAASLVDAAVASVTCIDSHTSFSIGDIQIAPFPVPHDAREPVQFVFSDGARRLGVLTDVGMVTPHIVDMLRGCEALVLECNHDATMLADGPYPPQLKRRVSGRLGHLDNAAAAELLRCVNAGNLQHVVAAHLSEQNNRPDLARSALATVAGCDPDRIGVATQEDGFDWRVF